LRPLDVLFRRRPETGSRRLPVAQIPGGVRFAAASQRQTDGPAGSSSNRERRSFVHERREMVA